MLANCTIVNENYNNIVDFKPGKSAKAAKLSTYKNFYPKTVEIMKKFQKKEEPVATPEVNTQNVVPFPTVTNESQVTSSVSQPLQNTPVETKNENNIVNFPTSEIYQKELGVTCYKNVSRKGKIIPRAAKRLRTAYLVPKRVNEARMKLGIDVPVLEKEEKPTPEVKEDVKQTFDFSSLQNMGMSSNNQEPKEVPQPKPTLSVDDYFKKENEQNAPSEENNLDEIITLSRDLEIIQEATESIEEKRISLIERNKKLDEQKLIRIEELREKKEFYTEKYNNLSAEVAELERAIREKEESLGMGKAAS